MPLMISFVNLLYPVLFVPRVVNEDSVRPCPSPAHRVPTRAASLHHGTASSPASTPQPVLRRAWDFPASEIPSAGSAPDGADWELGSVPGYPWCRGIWVRWPLPRSCASRVIRHPVPGMSNEPRAYGSSWQAVLVYRWLILPWRLSLWRFYDYLIRRVCPDDTEAGEDALRACT